MLQGIEEKVVSVIHGSRFEGKDYAKYKEVVEASDFYDWVSKNDIEGLEGHLRSLLGEVGEEKGESANEAE